MESPSITIYHVWPFAARGGNTKLICTVVELKHAITISNALVETIPNNSFLMMIGPNQSDIRVFANTEVHPV